MIRALSAASVLTSVLALRSHRSALLCSDDSGFRRDCTSCSLGSAYFSLLRPRTRLAAHCGPTNARLRAHLGIVVPEGDCEIICGGEARRWEEGKVIVFDDSFEHEVHNETDQARARAAMCRTIMLSF